LKVEDEIPDEAEGERLHNDFAHYKGCHARWLEHGNRFLGEVNDAYAEQWYREKCGACRYFVRLTGVFFDDWGACTNSESPMDRRVVLEHDGCDKFSRADGDWEYKDPLPPLEE